MWWTSEAGIECRTLLGPQIDTATIDEVYDLHRDTFLRHGNEPYLTREFFRRLTGKNVAAPPGPAQRRLGRWASCWP